MRVFFESKGPSYFTVYKLTLVPGENIIQDDIGESLLKAHAEDCKRSGDKPRIRKLEDKKPELAKVATSATPKSAAASKPVATPKKGAK